jgi:hypothetical protein
MTNRTALGIALALIVLGVLFRTLVSGWGPPAETPAAQATLFGLAGYPADNLSYVSWAQQAHDGRWLFDILYTTTTHDRLFFNPLFLLVGRLASLLSVSPLLVLNVLALFSLPIVVLCIAQVGRSLGLSSAATLAATCLAIGGAGLSWLRRVIEWAGVRDLLLVGPVGPDLSFYDVYPVVAYFVAPYHAASLAFLALLTLVIVRYDDDSRGFGTAGAVALAGMGVLVASIRPHTAIMVLVAYGAVTTATLLADMPASLRRRRVGVCALLAVAMLPPVLYSVWVAQQPVWSAYAGRHPDERHDWLIGFFLLWALGAAGAASIGWPRLLRSPFAFLAAWALGAASLLLVLNGLIYPKLTYGFTIALAVLAGVAIDRYGARLTSPRIRAAAVVLLAFLALASPLLMMRGFVVARGTLSYSEFFEVVRALRQDAVSPFPAVLTDCDTGVLLPGLSGARVFCGHWALTDDNRQKIVLLSRLGFLEEGRPVQAFPNVGDEDVETQARRLADQLSTNTFQYLIVRKRDRIYGSLSAAADCTVKDGDRFVLFRMCPEVRSRLSAAVASETRTRHASSRSNS